MLEIRIALSWDLLQIIIALAHSQYVGTNRGPDSNCIAFTSADEKTEERKKKDKSKNDAKVYGEDWEYNRVRILDVVTKEVTTLFDEGAHVGNIEWSQDGKQIAFVTYKTPQLDDFLGAGAIVNILNVEKKQKRMLCHFPSFVQNLTWHVDDLLWVSDIPVGTGTRVYRLQIKDKGEAEAEHFGYGKNECSRMLRLCGDEVIVYVQEGLSDQLRVLQSKTLFSEECDLQAGWDALIRNGQASLVVTKGAAGVPEEVFSVVDGKTCQLSTHNKDIGDQKLAQGQALRCRAEDGLPLDGVIYIPKSLVGKEGPYPTAVVVHGGPYSRVTFGSDPFFAWPIWMLSLGYVVLMPNYRGSSSRGVEFATTVHGDIGASYGDVIALVKEGIKAGIVDPGRVAVTGWSQGGYLSYLSIGRDSTFHFAAAIAGAGVTSWDTMALTSDIPTFEKRLSGGAPWEGSQSLDMDANPIFFVKNVVTPLLILHAEKDERVPCSQAVGFHRGMLQYGKECTMVIYPREGHGYPVPFEKGHYIDMLKRIKDFLAKHLE